MGYKYNNGIMERIEPKRKEFQNVIIMINNKKPPYTQEEVEEIRKQRYLKQLDYWKNRTEMFTIVETIPSVPVVEEEVRESRRCLHTFSTPQMSSTHAANQQSRGGRNSHTYP